MRRILFVDDEPHILEGLQNNLRKERRHWDMKFAIGAEAALAELERGGIDVVVSDMRMPGMDGASLLQKVKEDYPRAARIILSGHADNEGMTRALHVAHQFLSKPCEVDVLRSTIERTSVLQELLNNGPVPELASRLDMLPSVPRTYHELIRVLADPAVSVTDIVAIVEKDPAMTAKVLQLVNSAYFGLGTRVTSIPSAVSQLGSAQIKWLALEAHIFALQGVRARSFSHDRFQRSSLLTARMARRVLGSEGSAEEAFAAGLLRDVGQVVLAYGMPETFDEIAARSEETGTPDHVLEKEILGASHAEIGAYLLGLWGLPFPILEAVAFHHVPGHVGSGECRVLAAVHVADAVVATMLRGGQAGLRDIQVDRNFLPRAGDPDRIPSLLAELEAESKNWAGEDAA